MEVTIDLPEDVVNTLTANGENIERQVLEAVALEGYREEKLSQAQVRRMLGYQTDMQVDAFLKAHNVFLNYTIEDLEQDRKNLEKLLAK